MGDRIAYYAENLGASVLILEVEELPELGQALWGAVMRSVGGKFYTPPAPPQ